MSLRNLTKERRNEILKEQQEKHEKLAALQRKSPEDLYEDDLYHFEAEYHKAIEKERADEMSEVAHYTTKKVAGATTTDGKSRKKQIIKPQRLETKPAPNGQRIQPVIDPAFVKKVTEELIKRNREEKTIADKRTIIEYLVKEGVASEEISEIMQIRCKEKKRIGNATEKKPNETTKEKKMDGTLDENSNSSIISIDGKDNTENIKEEISPKRNAKRTAKGKVVKYGSDEDNEENQENIDDNEPDYVGSDSEIEKKIKKTKSKPKIQSPEKKNALSVLMQNRQNKDENKTEKPKKPRAKKEPSTTTKKETVKKETKTAKRPKPSVSDDDDDIAIISASPNATKKVNEILSIGFAKKEPSTTTKKETVKKETKTAKRPKPSVSDDDDDIAIISASPNASKKARTQRDGAPKKNYHISDDDDFD
ncbi:unnamed protein product [Rotaria sp. Silwood1]|nr:unnamed protein product [Rotaria sp. Silwood1]